MILSYGIKLKVRHHNWVQLHGDSATILEMRMVSGNWTCGFEWFTCKRI